MPNLASQRLAFLVLLMLGITPLICRAQTIFEGQVIDKTTEALIPGVTVKLAKEKIATSTSGQGHFVIKSEKSIANDSLIFTAIGYKTYGLPVTAYERKMFIALEPSVTELKNVNITNRKIKTPTVYKFSGGEIKNSTNNATVPFAIGDLYAKYIKVDQPNAKINQISVGMRQFEDGYPGSVFLGKSILPNPNCSFKVHVIACDKATKQPAQTLFTKTVTLNEDLSKLVIELTQENWRVEENEFFIAFEWLKIPINETFKLGSDDVVRRTTTEGEQKLEQVALYTMVYRPALVQFNLTNKRTDILAYTKSNYGGWSKLPAMPQIAFSVAVTYLK